MEQRKIATQLTELNQAVFNNPFITIMPRAHNPEKSFFRFVDKNPLFSDNSKNAIHEIILVPRKTRPDFKPHFDEDYEKITYFLAGNHFHHRNK